MRMAPPSKTKTSKSRSQPSVPCEVFFACTLCGERCRTVPKLYSHYRSVHREEVVQGERRLQDKGTAGSDSAECKDRGGKSPKSASSGGSPGTSQTRDKDGSNLARRQSPNSDSRGSSPLRSQTEGKEVVKTTKNSKLDCSVANLPIPVKGNEKETEKQGRTEGVQRDLSEKAETKDEVGGKIKNGDSNDLAENKERSRKHSKSDLSEGSSTNGKEQRLRAESGDRQPSENSPIEDKLEDKTSDRERSNAMEHQESIGTSPKSNSSESSPGNGSKVGKEKRRRAEGRKGESCSGKKKLKRGDDSSQGQGESSRKKPGEEELVTRSSRVESNDGTTTRYTVTRKKNVPLGMLEGKKNSLMVIFQHAERNKPLPEGSSFKLRNTGGEQTYLVVANVDVEITDCEKIVTKA